MKQGRERVLLYLPKPLYVKCKIINTTFFGMHRVKKKMISWFISTQPVTLIALMLKKKRLVTSMDI